MDESAPYQRDRFRYVYFDLILSLMAIGLCGVSLYLMRERDSALAIVLALLAAVCFLVALGLNYARRKVIQGRFANATVRDLPAFIEAMTSASLAARHHEWDYALAESTHRLLNLPDLSLDEATEGRMANYVSRVYDGDGEGPEVRAFTAALIGALGRNGRSRDALAQLELIAQKQPSNEIQASMRQWSYDALAWRNASVPTG